MDGERDKRQRDRRVFVPKKEVRFNRPLSWSCKHWSESLLIQPAANQKTDNNIVICYIPNETRANQI